MAWWKLLRYRQAWAFVLGKFLTDPVWWFYLFWLPGYFNSRFKLDLSHIGLDESGDGARQRLERICAALPAGSRIQVGAEQAGRADKILDIVIAASREGASLSATIQANLKRSRVDADRLAQAGVPVRLVKGAYVEPPRGFAPVGRGHRSGFRRASPRTSPGRG